MENSKIIKSVKIKENLFWIGALDYDLRTFDIIMHTDHGTTYNSYILKGENKTALIELAKENFSDGYIKAIEEVCSIKDIDYVIVNHTEPDHTGSLARLLEINPNLEVIGSSFAIKFLRDITNKTYKERVVKEGDELDLGGKTLKFIMAPLLHWPDSMYTYCPEEGLLFTCDSFGCHYCSDQVFADLITDNVALLKSYKYYFDMIMGPFKSKVRNALEKIANLKFDTILPGHGPAIRQNKEEIIKYYQEWSQEIVVDKKYILIAYVSNYGYTKKMAEKISEGIIKQGKFAVQLFDLEKDLNKAIEKALGATGIMVGSPTLLADTLPQVWQFLTSLNPIIHCAKIAAAFGTFGWSGEAINNIENRFSQLKYKMPIGHLKVAFNPDVNQLSDCLAFGENFAVECFKTG